MTDKSGLKAQRFRRTIMKFYPILLYLMIGVSSGAYSNTKSAPERLPERVRTAPQSKALPSRQSAPRVEPSRNLPKRSMEPLHVNYGEQPVFLDRGQEIYPLCDKPATLECVAQWSRQAVPLVSHTGGSLPPTASYYLPAFAPQSKSDEAGKPVDKGVWKLINYIQDEDGIKFYRDRSNPDRVRRVSEDSDEEGNIFYINENSIGRKGQSYTIKIGTHAFTSTTEEAQPGCFVIEKESRSSQAGYCFVCNQSQDSLEILENVGVDLNTLDSFLGQVDKGTGRNISGKIGSGGDYTEKICSPQLYLQEIIDNFEASCGMSFEDFFRKSYCASCSQSIPIEVMMSIMSIESAGDCKAHGVSGVNENSFGLLQIDINSHKKCVETRNIKQTSLEQCLKHPVNNLMSSLDILKQKFKEVNPASASAKLSKTANQCSRGGGSWLEFSSKEKDYWRRAVSAYNGGSLWVTRAIASALEREKVKKEGTVFLIAEDSSSYKEQEIPWETLRQLYFLERLAPSNNLGSRINTKCGVQNSMQGRFGRTGRKVTCTISNLAYVESVLGRDLATRQPPLIEVWHQYKLNFLKERGGQIDCEN